MDLERSGRIYPDWQDLAGQRATLLATDLARSPVNMLRSNDPLQRTGRIRSICTGICANSTRR
jgi:hypothetical protein